MEDKSILSRGESMIAGNDRMMQRADRNNDEVYTPFCAVELILEFLQNANSTLKSHMSGTYSLH